VADPLENPTLNFYRTLFGLLGCYNKKIGFFKFGLTTFPGNLTTFPFMKIDEKFTKSRLIDETINRLNF
jgi:hypothetical protein